MDTQKRRVVILSGELSNLSVQENKMRTRNLESCLYDLNITNNIGIGVYKNSVETCFVCLPKNVAEVQALQDLAFRSFNQECILYQGNTGKAFIVPQEGNYTAIGKLRLVTKKQAYKQAYYTVLNNQYYVAS